MEELKEISGCVDFNILKKYFTQEKLKEIDNIIIEYLKYLEKYDNGTIDIIEKYCNENGNTNIIDWYEGLKTTDEFIKDYWNLTDLDLLKQDKDNYIKILENALNNALDKLNEINDNFDYYDTLRELTNFSNYEALDFLDMFSNNEEE